MADNTDIPSITSVARVAGVSIATVSRVLNNSKPGFMELTYPELSSLDYLKVFLPSVKD